MNSVILIGRLGADPEIRTVKGDSKVVEVSLATDRFVKGKKVDPDWHRIVAWNRTAEILNMYTEKGSLIAVEGSLRSDSWNDKETGQKRSRTTVSVYRLHLLSFKDNGKRGAGQAAAAETEEPAEVEYPVPDDFDDDLPF